MNTLTNHEQLSKQEAEIWTLLQTMNSSQNKRVKYEHSYKPWTALKNTRGKIWTLLQTMNSSQNKEWNMNTPTNHEQLKKQETPTNNEQLSK